MIFNLFCAALFVAVAVFFAVHIRGVLSENPEIMLCVDGSPIGFIRDRSIVEEGADLLTKEVYLRTGEAYRYRGELSYRFVRVSHGVSYLTAEKFRDLMLGYIDFETRPAYALYIDGVFVCYAESENAVYNAITKIERMESELLKEYGAKYIGLSAEIETCEALVTGEEVLSSGRLYNKLSAAVSSYSLKLPEIEDEYETAEIFALEDESVEISADMAVASDSEAIPPPVYAQSFGDGVQIARNKGVDADSSGIERAMALCDPAIDFGIPATAVTEAEEVELPTLTFRYSCRESAVILSPYETKYEYTSNRLTDYRELKSVGIDGREAVTYLSVYEGDDLVSRTVTDRRVLINPVDEIIELGTVEITDPGVSTGRFLWPVFYDGEPTITSYYGVRRPEFDGGGYHLGIDIYEPEGTGIFASDGGTISYVDHTRSYGNMVIIDHADGLQSCYAHLLESYVNVGDAVRQGQLIALSGATGAVTAPHLHFEIRLNLHTIDPFKYLPDY